MKTVIQFIHELGDGGGSSIVKDYALCLKNDGYHVVVLVVFPELTSVNYKIIREAGIEIMAVFENRSLLHRIQNIFFATSYISKKIKNLLMEYHPIALHAHLQVLTYLKPCSHELKGVNLIYTCHSTPKRYFTGKYASEFDSAQYLIIHNDLQLIALHPEMKETLQAMFAVNNVIVVNNGIDLDRFISAHPDRTKMRKNLGIPKDSFVVGHIGRFSKVKNHDLIVNIFNDLCKIQKNAFLLLIGTGELRHQIETSLREKGLSDKCLILTHRTDVPELLKLMDIFLFPSVYEGLGIVLIEAQVAHLPCVISDTIPTQSIISNYVSRVSLNAPIKEWCRELLKEFDKDFVGDSSAFNIKDVVKKVEYLYER